MEEKIRQALETVIDPGVGMNALRVGVVQDLQVEMEKGRVCLTFRPSSSVCPVAFTLAGSIQKAIASVPGVNSVSIKVENFDRAEELEAFLCEE